MDGYNMEKSKGNQSIFKKESIEAFLEGLKKWIGYRKLKLYYYGSYFYDIEGHLADIKDNEVWPDEQLDDNQKKMKSSFEKEDFWKGSISITESIQNQYLNLFQQGDPEDIDILHIFRDSDSEICETINPLTSNTSPKELAAFIVTNDNSIKNKIKNSFKNHFELIKDSGAHIYFFPTILRLKNRTNVINVTTIISPKALDAEEIYYIKGGLSFCSEKLTSDTTKYLSDIASLEAIKSAIAAIMSRNMSHNLGSHDISNTKNYFSRRLNDECFYDKNIVNDEDLLLWRSDYRGNVRLLQYIQERMDFIATIVSTDHYPFGPLNFKAEFFDIFTNDDCGERHNKPERNFLLLYLLYSEKYTRINVNPKEDYGDVRLEVIYKDKRYTGLKKVKDAEQSTKTDLSKLLLAVPGGVMSRHALFTIVENILRNSAKHNNHVKELILTIKVKEEDGKIKLSFYDNCESANEEMLDDNGKQIKVWENIKRKLENIIIIDNNGVINKHDKGLKEMLICALWLQNKDVTETLFNIQNGNDNATKYLEVSTEGKNLCYSVTLEKFEKYHVVTPGLDQKVSEDQLLNIHADFIMSDKDYIVGHTKLSDIFPRFIQGEWKDVYNEIDNTNKKYALVVEINPEGVQLPSGVVLKDEQGNLEESKKRICFYDHLTNKGKQNDFDTAKKDKNIVYLDSISGENFTSTLVTPDFLEDKVLRYKVIQSALARIAILDERIWNNFRSGCKINSDSDNSKKEQYKQILSKTSADNIDSLLNEISGIDYDYYEELLKRTSSVSKEEKVSVLKDSLLEKINARLFIPDITCQLLETKHIFVYTIEDGKLKGLDGNEVEKAPNFDFVTVHLGLVEKLPDNSGGFEEFLEKHGIREMGKQKPFVSIHSGRGNFSPELEESLKDYPFISLSAVESALDNSKYLLSELFYNTNYYGKGNINHK